jgi:hypothetical protein
MSNDVLITPASRKIEFKDSSANIDAVIETDASGNLNITNAGGDIQIGDTATDVYIGNGVANVDIIYEQSGEIRAVAGQTLTLGGTGSLSLGSDLNINSKSLTGTGSLSIGAATFTSDSNALTIRTASNGVGAEIRFSDQIAATLQFGYLTYFHSDTASYGSGNAFIFGSSEATTTILADGKLMYGEGLYLKPATGTGAGTRKDLNWDTAYGWGNHASAGYLTSHQSLSAYLLNTTDTFAGNLTFIGGNNNSKESFINVKRGDASGLWLKFQTDSTSANNVSQFVIRRSTDSVDILNLTATNGNIAFVGTVTASGGNSTNWNTAYTTANAALPKAGGTMTGTLNTKTVNIKAAGLGSNGITSQALQLSNPNDSAYTANGLSAYNATTSWDISDRVTFSGSSRPKAGSIYTYINEHSTSPVAYERFVQLSSTANNAVGMRDMMFYQYDGTGTATTDMKKPVGNLITVRTYTAASTPTVFALDSDGDLTLSGTVTASGGNSGQWNTAYGWGDHSTAGYASGSFLPLSGGTLSGSLTLEKTGTATVSDQAYNSQPLYFQASGWDTNNAVARTLSWTIKNEPTASVYPDFDLTFSEDTATIFKLHGRGTSGHVDGRSGTFFGNLHVEAGAGTGAGNGSLNVAGTVTASGGNSGQWNTAYGWGNHASAGYITSSTGTFDSLRIASGGTTSDVQEGKEYKYYLVGQSVTDGNWKKVCDVTIATGLYKALTMNITLESQDSNFGSVGATQTSKFSATYYRSAGTQDDQNNATISGQNTTNHELRILKTATGAYELQIKMLNHYRDAIVKIEVLSTNGGTVSVPSSIVNGSTTGTAYTPSTSTSVKTLYNEINAGTITATGGNSTNWNTAHGWGNHASAGYVTTDTNTHTHLDRTDNRIISPSEYTSGDLNFGFTSWANDDTSPYADFIHMRSYTDSSGGSDNMVMFKKSGIGMRLWQQAYGSSTAYSSYEDVWHTGNLTATNKANYDTAYGWGNHASAGYITGVTAGTGLSGGATSGSATLNIDWKTNETFTGTYPVVWNANNDPYTVSWFTVNGSTDTVTAPNLAATEIAYAQNIGHAQQDILFAITDHDTTASIRNKFEVTSQVSKVDDPTAPASGIFEVTGYLSKIFGAFIPISDDTEIMFETWVKYVSGGDASGDLYVGGQFYNGSKSDLGNNNRYWGANGNNFDSNEPAPAGEWHHIKGILKGSSIRGISSTSTAEYVRLLVLLNYNANANTTRYCGFKFYQGRQTVSSLYHKRHNTTDNYSNTGFAQTYGSSSAFGAYEVLDSKGALKNIRTITSNSIDANYAGDFTGAPQPQGAAGQQSNGLYIKAGSSSNDNSFKIDNLAGSQIAKINGFGQLTLAGTISASGYNSGNWNTAYGWGNHASAGYLTSGSFLPLTGGTLTGNTSLETAANPTITIKNTDTTIVADQVIGTVEFRGADDSGNVLAGHIQQVSTGAWGVANYGSDMVFSIKVGGTGGAFTEKLRLGYDGAEITKSLKVAGIAPTNSSPATDEVELSGYGLIGNRGNVYITNSNANGQIVMGISGAHNANARLTVTTSGITVGGTVAANGTVSATGGNSTNWNTAYGWGDHSTAGYLTSGSFLPLAGGTMTGDLTIPSKIIHSGDSNTYMQFHAADQWRVVTGGTERLEVNNTAMTSTLTITAPAYKVATGGATLGRDPGNTVGSMWISLSVSDKSFAVSDGNVSRFVIGGAVGGVAGTGVIESKRQHKFDPVAATTSDATATMISKGSVDTTTGYQPQNWHMAFQDGGGTVRGKITSSHYATQYSTSSDYRLKEDIQPIANATARLLAIEAVNFRWIDGQQRSDGFIAHELQEHLPEAVTGEKDATEEVTETVVAEDGTESEVTRTIPALQGVDQSKLVPLLVKTIQELEARITALENA